MLGQYIIDRQYPRRQVGQDGGAVTTWDKPAVNQWAATI